MKNAGFLGKFALGYAVTVTAGLLSYPLDTIRRRMMMTSGSYFKYTNPFVSACLSIIIKCELNSVSVV